jgi:putative transcriptional regulator
MRESSPHPFASDDSLAGQLLLAHPVLRDETFRRTAILMSAHDREGAMGVVLNRPLNKRLGELGGDFAYGPLAAVPVFDGGPVEKRQIILCAWRRRAAANDGETTSTPTPALKSDPAPSRSTGAADTFADQAPEVAFQVLFGLDPAQASELVGQEGVQLRAYLGYAGWSGGQLEGELARDTWVVANLEPAVLGTRPDETLWRRVLVGLDPSWHLAAGEPDEPERN